jgi:hypothetical protein
VIGASTLCTLPSSTKISRARKHSALTSFSRKYSHLLRRSICESNEDDDAVVAVLLKVAGMFVEVIIELFKIST